MELLKDESPRDVFAVVKNDGVHEVRCLSYRAGEKVDDRLVVGFRFKSDAEAVASFLATRGEDAA